MRGKVRLSCPTSIFSECDPESRSTSTFVYNPVTCYGFVPLPRAAPSVRVIPFHKSPPRDRAQDLISTDDQLMPGKWHSCWAEWGISCLLPRSFFRLIPAALGLFVVVHIKLAKSPASCVLRELVWLGESSFPCPGPDGRVGDAVAFANLCSGQPNTDGGGCFTVSCGLLHFLNSNKCKLEPINTQTNGILGKKP